MKEKREVTRERINAWNNMVELSRGTEAWYTFALYHEFISESGKKWISFNRLSGIRDGYIEHDGERFYLKTIKGETYLYWEYLTDKERWLLDDLAKAFFEGSKF